MEKEPITSEGLIKIKKELEELKNFKRPKIIEAIAEARGHGDLSENAEYQYAKEQQSLIEGKIADLENTISHAEVIDIKEVSGEEIKFGATVKIQDNTTGKKSTYNIVGEYESDIENKKLSVNSPLARGLIGKVKNEVVEINSPKGLKTYKIISVKYI